MSIVFMNLGSGTGITIAFMDEGLYLGMKALPKYNLALERMVSEGIWI